MTPPVESASCDESKSPRSQGATSDDMRDTMQGYECSKVQKTRSNGRFMWSNVTKKISSPQREKLTISTLFASGSKHVEDISFELSESSLQKENVDQSNSQCPLLPPKLHENVPVALSNSSSLGVKIGSTETKSLGCWTFNPRKRKR